MRVTKNVLKQLVYRVEEQIKVEMMNDGDFEPIVFFYDNNLEIMTEFFLGGMLKRR